MGGAGAPGADGTKEAGAKGFPDGLTAAMVMFCPLVLRLVMLSVVETPLVVVTKEMAVPGRAPSVTGFQDC